MISIFYDPLFVFALIVMGFGLILGVAVYFIKNASSGHKQKPHKQ